MVMLWLAAALVWPSSLVTISEADRLPVALLGVLFLACGVGAWWVRPGRWTAVLLVYAIGGGVHWGGTVDPQHAGLELSLLFVYLAFSALSEAALLHLALIFPSGRPLRRSVCIALYSVAAPALLVAPLAGFLSEAILGQIIGITLIVANLLSVAAGVLFLVSLIRVDSATRRAAHLPLVVTSMIVAFSVGTLGTEGILLPQSDLWNLASGLIPISLAFALVSPARTALKEYSPSG